MLVLLFLLYLKIVSNWTNVLSDEVSGIVL